MSVLRMKGELVRSLTEFRDMDNCRIRQSYRNFSALK